MTGFIQSPNRWVGRRGYKPEAIVIHITDGSYIGAHAWLLNPKSQVSAHFLVRDDGYYDQLVKCEDSAWHCGVVVRPTWKLLKKGVNPNLYTIGIEIAALTTTPMNPAIYKTVARLVSQWATIYQIPLDRDHIIGHREIRADKTCPGDHVDLDTIISQAICEQG